MPIPTDRLFAEQWHLRAAGVARFDLNVLRAWAPAEGPGYSGAGTRTVVIDDGFDHRHRDLAANYNDALDFDFGSGTDDAIGTGFDAHGTAVAGLIGAAADGRGAVGVAHRTELVGYRVDFTNAFLREIRDAVTAAAADAGADLMNISLGTVSPYGAGGAPVRFQWVADAIGTAVEVGRDGLGATIVKAAGNYREDLYDANADPWTNDTRQVIVGAVDRDGYVSYYSSYGASLLVSAFGTPGEVVTTDRVGLDGYSATGYSRAFNGTSAAAPMVSGVVALMYDANDGLGWRDVQSILAASARHVGSDVGARPMRGELFGWDWNGAETWNGGGQHFSNDYGYGLVDGLAAVRLAESWHLTGAGAATILDEAGTRLDLLDADTPVPDGRPRGISFEATTAVDHLVERVSVRLAFSTTFAEDVDVYLTSPAGTQCQLVGDAGGRLEFKGYWTFGSQAFRGEQAAGTWSVRVVDDAVIDQLVVGDIIVRIHGADTADDRYVFTEEYSELAGVAGHATDVLDTNGGSDTVNAAAVRSASTIRLDGGEGSIDGVAVSFDGIEHAIGGDGNDRLFGEAAGNTLHGMRGRDLLIGGLGADRLCGGSGSDRFRFRDVAESAAGDPDEIVAAKGRAFNDPGVAGGDLIELRRLDADEAVAGNQAFVFDDSEAAGTLRCVDDGTVTRVLGFTDGVAGADFELLILDRKVGAAAYTADDFVL